MDKKLINQVNFSTDCGVQPGEKAKFVVLN
jgi:hypothetical protein